MRNSILARLICFAMFIVMVLCSCVTVMATDETESEAIEQGGNKTSLEELREVLEAESYEDYLAKVEAIADIADEEVEFSAVEYAYGENLSELFKTDSLIDGEGNVHEVLLLPDEGKITFKIVVPKTGLYTFKAKYCTDGTSYSGSSTIERSFKINGKLPFSEARSIEFTRAWQDVYLKETEYSSKVVTDENGTKFVGSDKERFVDSDGVIKYISRVNGLSGDKKVYYPAFKWDVNNNDIRLPKEQIKNNFREEYFSDSTGYVPTPFLFYLEEGVQEVSLEAVREAVWLESLTIGPAEHSDSYAVYADKNKSKKNLAEGEIYIEAEYPTATSDKSIYPSNDRTSAITSPQDASQTRLNVIGGSKWQEIGQWISYDIEVPADGYYNISMRFMQSTMEGLFTSRKILIDGEVPFAEAAGLRFNYGRGWQLEYLSDNEGNPYKFYLEKGKHTITLEVVLGDMASVISKVSDANAHINDMYLDILMLTGSDPDAYIDYEFIKNLPEVVRGLRAEGQNIYNIAADLTEIVGEAGSNTATLEKVAYLCEKIGYDTDLIARNLDRLKSDIGTIGTWIQSVSKQPLTIDYILLTPSHTERSKDYKGAAGFIDSLAFEFESFFMSFFTDYTSVGVTVESGEIDEDDVVEVWYQVDRDRASVIRQMIDNDFTANTGIPVNFKLVAAGSLLPSILAGVGPDVMIGLGSSDVINYAIRSAVHPLNEFEDLEENLKQFESAATTPLTMYDQVYGLPMTMNFSMLFYRADILLELGLEIPETWDDFYDMIPAVLANKLDIGYHVGEPGLYLFQFQTEEELYKNHTIRNADGTTSTLSGMQINLDSNVSLSCFKKMCDLITLYDLPLAYSFANRFRTGEMPIGIQDIATYNELTLFAPEIAGLWGMVAVPGTPDANGKLDYSSPVTVTATVIIENRDENYDYSDEWEFVKWWSGSEAQTDFGSEVVSIMGDGAKYFTANTEALKTLPWTKQEYDNIMYQFNSLSAKPEMPGGYIITRYVTFAYQAVYNDKKDAVQEMYSYIDEINAELTRKRKEFELATMEDFIVNDDGTLTPKEEGMKIAPDGRLYTVEEYNKLFGGADSLQ